MKSPNFRADGRFIYHWAIKCQFSCCWCIYRCKMGLCWHLPYKTSTFTLGDDSIFKIYAF